MGRKKKLLYIVGSVPIRIPPDFQFLQHVQSGQIPDDVIIEILSYLDNPYTLQDEKIAENRERNDEYEKYTEKWEGRDFCPYEDLSENESL